MATPYILPQMLKDAPLGIDWTSVGSVYTTPLDNTAALWDVCWIATGTVDRSVYMPLRATGEVETLEGPTFRVTIDRWTGVARAIMSHWPVINVLGARYSPTGAYPRAWSQIPSNMMSIFEPLNQLLSGTELGISGGDGSNTIEIAPGYVTASYGRKGTTIQLAYENGWPHAGILPQGTVSGVAVQRNNRILVFPEGKNPSTLLQPTLPLTDKYSAFAFDTKVISINGQTVTISKTPLSTVETDTLYLGYNKGATRLRVDDVTAFAGTRPRIYDGAYNEQITVTSVTATTPIELLPTVISNGGTGYITLASPTRYDHFCGDPAVSLVTTIPDAVRSACYFFAAAYALSRGSTATSLQSIPGSMGRTPGPTIAPDGYTKQAEHRLANFIRII